MRSVGNMKSERGVVILAVFVLIIIGVLVAAFLFVKNQQAKKPVSTTAAEVVEAGGEAISRSAQNKQRENDAGIAMAAVAAYAADNNGRLPTEFTTGMLLGMGHYTSVTVASGEQDAVTTDELRVATGARCLASGATTTGSSRQYAAQYSTKLSNGSFESQCIDG